MKKLFLVSIFVLLLQFGVSAQNNEFDKGLDFARNGDFQNALPHFQSSLDNKLSVKKLAQIHYNIGVCFYQLKYSANAVGEFQAAVKLNPNYEKAFYALGMAETDLQNWNLAETAFQKSLGLAKGRNGEVWFDLAFVYVEQKKYDEAFLCFQNAIKFGSMANSASHNNLGVIYALRGDFTNAQKEIELSKNLGFNEAENNLKILRKVKITNDKTLIGKLTLQEKKNER